MKLKIVCAVFCLMACGGAIAQSVKASNLKKGGMVSLSNGQIACVSADHLSEYFARLAAGQKDLAEQLVFNKDNPDLEHSSCLHVPEETKFKVVSVYKPESKPEDEELSELTAIVGLKEIGRGKKSTTLYTMAGLIEKTY